MNWLAHAYLSKPNIEFRVGNILPDLVSITELRNFPPLYQEGISCHKAIDAFTDSHPIVKGSISRMPQNYKRFGGILTDVFYDHFLAKHWVLYSSVSLNEFSHGFYADLQTVKNNLPGDVFYKFQRMFENKIFETYQDISGISIALQRIDSRLRRPANLGDGMEVLEKYYADYEQDFFLFFSQLQRHVDPYISEY
jgi:acyl carrier protein phosphodiesterase